MSPTPDDWSAHATQKDRESVLLCALLDLFQQADAHMVNLFWEELPSKSPALRGSLPEDLHNLVGFMNSAGWLEDFSDCGVFFLVRGITREGQRQRSELSGKQASDPFLRFFSTILAAALIAMVRYISTNNALRLLDAGLYAAAACVGGLFFLLFLWFRKRKRSEE